MERLDLVAQPGISDWTKLLWLWLCGRAILQEYASTPTTTFELCTILYIVKRQMKRLLRFVLLETWNYKSALPSIASHRLLSQHQKSHSQQTTPGRGVYQYCITEMQILVIKGTLYLFLNLEANAQEERIQIGKYLGV